jgi:outer membrane protein assembly factor BamB
MMKSFRRHGLQVLFAFALAACSSIPKTALVDPFPLRFPLIEVGSLDIEGMVVGQPRARDGIVYFGARDGSLTAVDARSQAVLWRFQAESPIAFSPELGDSCVIVRDGGGRFYVLDDKGRGILKKTPEGGLTTAVREDSGRLYFGDLTGRIVALDMKTGGKEIWKFQAPGPVFLGPVFSGDLVIFGTAEVRVDPADELTGFGHLAAGRLLALSRDGKLAWEYALGGVGAISADPAAHEGRLYFGTNDRVFYCLNAATGKRIWSRRLQGAPVHQAFIADGTLAVPASNSVVYLLSGRGGSILSWEAVPSRILYELAAANSLVLVSSASPAVVALDLKAAKRAGQYEASGPLVAGALWSPPFVILFEEGAESGRQRMTVLRSR